MPFKSAQLFLGSELGVHSYEFRSFVANYSGFRRLHMSEPSDLHASQDTGTFCTSVYRRSSAVCLQSSGAYLAHQDPK